MEEQAGELGRPNLGAQPGWWDWCHLPALPRAGTASPPPSVLHRHDLPLPLSRRWAGQGRGQE